MHCRKEKKGRMDYQIELSIQILQYEFLGPIKLSEWGPPMDKVAYIIFYKNKDVFNMIYVGESDKTESRDFFTKNDQFKCGYRMPVKKRTCTFQFIQCGNLMFLNEGSW